MSRARMGPPIGVATVIFASLCTVMLVDCTRSLRSTASTRLGYETVIRHTGDSLVAPNIVFTHLLKAGGTTIDSILGSIFSEAPSYVRQSTVFSMDVRSLADSFAKLKQDITSPASIGFAAYNGSDTFRIGNVRNPCSYLLSMWAFQSSPYGDSTGHGKVPHQCLEDTLQDSGTSAQALYGKDAHSHYSTPDDISRFRRWVRASAGKRLHYLSYRSYLAAQVDPFASSIPAFDDGQYFGCLGKVNSSEEARIVDRLEKVDLSQRYDCVIHTESLHEDMGNCMLKYAHRVQDASIRDTLIEKIKEVTATEGHTSRNSGRHGTCQQYFDDDTADFVWAREGAFASKLGYSKCCANAH